LNSNENSWRNTRSKTEFEFWSLSENLVVKFSVGSEMSSENKSAISQRMLLWTEWKGKFKSHTVPNVKIACHNDNIMDIDLSILKILQD